MTDRLVQASRPPRPRLALALQGGGAHGAYGWGVLERLLAAEVDIVAVSGASAGALNGATLVSGLASGGREKALSMLERLWTAVSEGSPLIAFDMEGWAGTLVEPMLHRTLEMSKLFSRYFAPLMPDVQNMGALRRVVDATIDLKALSSPHAIPLFISATKVANGSARLFTGAEITLDALMASACLPDLFAAVEIDGEHYWDGGFSANPALEPLIDCGATDVLILQITPFADGNLSSSLPDIVGRISDIGFNACLLRDLKALTGIKELATEAASSSPRLRALASTGLHLMEAPAELAQRGSSSKMDTRPSRIEALRMLGRTQADAWLAEHGGHLGGTSTLTVLPESVAS